MIDTELQKLKYPIGAFVPPSSISTEDINEWINVLETFPEKLSNLVKDFSEATLQTCYRPNGWTVKQVIHHLADSHHNSYTRFKWALTEDKPIIKAYDEVRWAELFDSKTAPIQLSLVHLKAIHAKLVYLLKGLTEDELNRSFIHPETKKEISLKLNIATYAWHSNHHYAHIEQALKKVINSEKND